MTRDFEVARGEVHALIGQNGAGKSTLIKVLTGVYRQGRRAHRVRRRARSTFPSPHAAQLAGLSTIYQEVNLVPFRSVAENVFLNREPKRFGLIDWGRMNREAAAILRRLDIDVDVTRPLYEYAIATQQMTALARALSTEAKLVIMDEPTSALAENEVQTLFRVIRQLKGEGISVVFVSHRLDELYAVCDRVTVMRDGRTIEERADVGASAATSWSRRCSAASWPSSSRTGAPPRTTRSPPRRRCSRRSTCAVAAPSTGSRCRSARVRSSGWPACSGPGAPRRRAPSSAPTRWTPARSRVDGTPLHLTSPARRGQEQDRLLAPRTARPRASSPQLSVRENLTLALLPHLRRHGIVDRKRQTETVDRFIKAIGIKCSSPDQPIRELSGGNQQKVLLARWLCTNPKLLMLDEPTRGIDVGAKRDIQVLVRQLADEGLAVLLISSELEEIIADSDRVVTLRDGRSVAELTGDEITEDALMQAIATGAAADSASATQEQPWPRPRRPSGR